MRLFHPAGVSTLVLAVLAGSVAVRAAENISGPSAAAGDALPLKLSETGLFSPGTTEIAADRLPYSPQYPLWSDGATKRRWLYLPPGKSIDASDADAWQFPPGTRLWKEFAYDRPIETRYIERTADGSWRFATYIWDAEGRDAELAPPEGVPSLPAAAAPGGTYVIPSREDCLACHEAAAVPVLGVTALQLSPDRDPAAPHAETPAAAAVDLDDLHALGMLRDLPAELLAEPPRIAAPTTAARAALGYLHGNCGHCHNDAGPLAAMDFTLLQSAAKSAEASERTLETIVGYPSEVSWRGIDTRLVPGEPGASMLSARMRSRNPLMQMPPLATRVGDAEAIALVERWIRHDLQPKGD